MLLVVGYNAGAPRERCVTGNTVWVYEGAPIVCHEDASAFHLDRYLLNGALWQDFKACIVCPCIGRNLVFSPRRSSLTLRGARDGLVHFLRRQTLGSGHCLCGRSSVALQSYLDAFDVIYTLYLVRPLDIGNNGI